MEILIAIGIFAVGMVAVASIFPGAIALQRESVEEVMSQQAVSNIESLMGARPFFDEHPDFFYDYDPSLAGFVQIIPVDLLNTWTQADRSFSSTDPVEDREIYWAPLVQNLGSPANPDWRTFVFVMAGDGLNDYEKENSLDWANEDDPNYFPGVAAASITSDVVDGFVVLEFNEFNNRQFDEPDQTPAGQADQIRMGDFFLGDNGVVYRAIAADDSSVTLELRIDAGDLGNRALVPQNYIWYGRPSGPGRTSPTKRILVLTDAVVEP